MTQGLGGMETSCGYRDEDCLTDIVEFVAHSKCFKRQHHNFKHCYVTGAWRLVTSS